MSWMSSSGSSSRATMSRYFASDSCPWPRIALAIVSISCGRRRVGVGDVALAADGQEQRMHAGGIDRVDGVDAGDHRRDDRPGQLVDELAEGRVLLRRPADDGERPDRVLAVVDRLDAQHGEVVGQAVVAEVVAERPLGLAARAGRSVPVMHEVGLGGHGQAAVGGDHGARAARPAPRRRPARASPPAAASPRRRVSAGGPPTKTLTRNGSPSPDRRRVVHADAAVDLVVQADLAVRLVLVARELDAVHAEVRLRQPGRSASSV